MKKRLLLGLIALTFIAGGLSARATLIVRELWDNVGVFANLGLAGHGNGSTSLGFDPVSLWTTDVSSNALIQVDVNFDDFPVDATGTNVIGLPARHDTSIQGGLWSDVFWGTGDVQSGIPANSPNNWDARLLASSAWINGNANGTYYFSADLNHNGNSAGGIALATGTNAADHFIAAGITWPSYPVLSPSGDIGSSDYITHGLFSDVSDTNSSLAEAQGLYQVKAYGDTNLVTGQTLLVGKIVTSVGGSTTVSIKAYNTALDAVVDVTDPTNWDATYTFTDTSVFKYMVVFMNSESAAYPYFEQGAFRIATTLGEVTAVEAFAPTFNPNTNTVNQPTPVTMSVVARNQPLTYQWNFNDSPILGATSPTYTLTASDPTNTGNYSVTVTDTNSQSTTSPDSALTVLPAAAPSATWAGTNVSRFTNSSVTFNPGFISGSTPFTYQWNKNVSTPVPAPAGTNEVLTLTNLQPGDAGSYTLHISNFKGSTDTAAGVLSVLQPSGAYEAAVLAVARPFAFWRLSETNGTVMHDYWGGNDGSAPQTSTYAGYNAGNNSFGVAGPNLPGFPAQSAMGTFEQAGLSRIDLPALPTYTTNMTIAGWVYAPNAFSPNDCGFFMSRDPLNNGGYGAAYGIDAADGSGQIGWYWGSLQGPGAPFQAGIFMSTNEWTFVAMVVGTDSIAEYCGFDPSDLQSNIATGLTLPIGASDIGPFNVGRNDYPYASSSSFGPEANADFSDVAVYYSALSPTQIAKLYTSGVGLGIGGAPDGLGNLILHWVPGSTLESAPAVTGPWTDLPSAQPPYSVTLGGGNQFFRLKW